MMRTIRCAAVVVVVVPSLTVVLTAGCTTNPATGKRYIDFLSTEEEVAVGRQNMGPMIEEYGGEVTDPAINDYVTGIGLDLASRTEGDYPSLPWEFTVLDSEVINAFALPGGKVFISRGLAERMTNEAQLAGVLGHEIGHVTAQHVDQRMSRQAGLGLGAAILGAAAGQSDSDWVKIAASAGVSAGGVFTMSFDRDEESESDKLGMRYMVRAGYNPVGQLQVMEILKAASSGGGQPEWLSTHPAPQTRINRIEKLLATKYKDVVNDPAYDVHEARFQAQFLSRLSALPPARGSALALSDHVLWCAVCRGGGGHVVGARVGGSDGVDEAGPSPSELARMRRVFGG